VREVFTKVPSTSIAPTLVQDASSQSPVSSNETVVPVMTVKRKAGAQPEPDLFAVSASKNAPKKTPEPPTKRKRTDLAASLGIKIKKKPVKSLV